jgi:hypothetical protein
MIFCSVGFYQMAKIAVTPSIVLAEFIWFKKRVSFSKVSFCSYAFKHFHTKIGFTICYVDETI